MELITTHVGADFDGFAAMIAARRLHPEARLFFPGSREESLRRALDSGVLAGGLDEVRQRDVDPAALRRLVLCDIRQPERLGVVGEWIARRPQVELVIYDHHPASPGDLPFQGRGIVDAAAGATSTLLAEELRRRDIAPAGSEATLLLMGIYEDTGSLTHATTTARDLAAAGWLLDHGGDLAAVRRWVIRQLDPVHLEILHRMVQGMEIHPLRGHRVGIVTVDLDEYVEELAPLVNRCLAIFGVELVYALFGEPERIAVIARGEVEGFDIAASLTPFGGGGHPTAASASVRGATLTEARERLLAALEQGLPPAARASDLMLTRFLTVPAATTVEAAKGLLNDWRVNAAPVVAGEPPRVLGAVSRQLLDAALQHGMGAGAVTRVMTTRLEWVLPDAPLDELAREMVGPHPRFVLVGDESSGQAVGVVTRMSVMRQLQGLLAADPRVDRRAQEHRVRVQPAADLLARLSDDVRRRVEVVREVSRELGARVYLVGGLVRDLMLERANRDVDLVVEGDGPAFARHLAQRLGGRARVHEPFLTAHVVDQEGFPIDVATARTESYRAPAALPRVQTSAIRQDLFRRDFTVNTLAIRLGPERAPELVDAFGARRDLEERRLRVLHSLSFIDDPTRVLRAVRLELRLGFALSPESARLVDVAVEEQAFARLSGGRLREELLAIVDDAAIALPGLERLQELGVLPVIAAGVELDTAARLRLRAAAAAWDWYTMTELAQPAPAARHGRLMLFALGLGLDEMGRTALAKRLDLTAGERRRLVDLPASLDAAAVELGRPDLAPHEASARLEPLAGEELLLLMAAGDERVRAWVRRDLVVLRAVRLELRGADLVAHGVVAGPRVGELLRRTLEARLDERIAPAEELAFALGLAREEGGRRDAETVREVAEGERKERR